MGSLQYGVPRMPKDVAKGRTPEELEPKVVKDGRLETGNRLKPPFHPLPNGGDWETRLAHCGTVALYNYSATLSHTFIIIHTILFFKRVLQ